MKSPLVETFDPGQTAWVASGFNPDALDATLDKKSPDWKHFWKHVFSAMTMVTAVLLTAGVIDLDPTGLDGVRAIIEDAVDTADKLEQPWIPLVVDGGEYFRCAHQLWGKPVEKKVLLLWGGFHFITCVQNLPTLFSFLLMRVSF